MSYSYNDLEKIANNPTRVIPEVLTMIENAWSGKNITFNSPSHPFIVSMDMIVGEAYALLTRHSDAAAKLYKNQSRSMSDLSRNLSDEEWYGLLAVPSSTNMAYMIPVSEIKRLAVDYTETDGTITNKYKKILIPKDTRILVNSTYFSIENGFEIRLMDHGGHSVVYDSTTSNPLNPIAENVLSTDYVVVKGTRFLRVVVPVRQLNNTPKFNIATTVASGLAKDTFSFNNYLYAIRAFITYADGSSTEMAISYNNENFDTTVPTLVIGLDNDNGYFTYEVPVAYITSGLGVGKIALYVYTTVGYYEQDLKTISAAQHVPEYLDYNYDNNQLGMYSSVLLEANNQVWITINAVTGGAIPRTFESVRRAAIYGNRRDSLPVTPNQYSFNIEDRGYSSVESIDFITKRLYKATRDLPTQNNKDGMVSSMNTYIGSILQSAEELVATGMVYDNGTRITIPSKTVFDITHTTTRIVPQSELSAISTSGFEAISNYVNSNALVYTPFHYVMDLTDNQAVLRMYQMDAPTGNYQRFLYENTNLGIELGIGSLNLSVTATGYVITLVCSSGSEYKALEDSDVGAQLCFIPENSESLVSLKGRLIGRNSSGERVWQFVISSEFDIDNNDLLYLNNLTQYGETANNIPTALTNTFSFLLLKTTDDITNRSDSDNKIAASLFDTTMQAIIESSWNITLGKSLDYLYTRIRPITGDAIYQKYTYNVPDFYEKDYPQRNDDGELVLGDDDLPILLHKKGDPKLDSNGNPVYKYLIGDFVKDANGNNVEVEARKLQYNFDFLGFDGAYYFTTDTYDSAFVDTTKLYLTDDIKQDMTAINNRSLDETEVMFLPKAKIGNIDVIINADVETTIRSDLSFTITVYLTKNGYDSEALQESLTNSYPEVINAMLGNTTISNSGLLQALKDISGDDVVDIKLDTLAGSTSIDVISNKDSSTGFSIRKVLNNNNNTLLTVAEDITLNFKLHKS